MASLERSIIVQCVLVCNNEDVSYFMEQLGERYTAGLEDAEVVITRPSRNTRYRTITVSMPHVKVEEAMHVYAFLRDQGDVRMLGLEGYPTG